MRVVAIDPGGTCGWAYLSSGLAIAGSVYLEDLPDAMLSHRGLLAECLEQAELIVCESFALRPHQAAKQDPTVPAAVGIGIVQAAAFAHDLPLRMLSPGVKSAGRAWACTIQTESVVPRAYVTDAINDARSEHERDALHLAAYMHREETSASVKGEPK